MKNKLKEIREKRKKLKVPEKPQKRSIKVIEYEDGSYSIKNSLLWDLPLKKNELLDAFGNWFDGSLENGINIEF